MDKHIMINRLFANVFPLRKEKREAGILSEDDNESDS